MSTQSNKSISKELLQESYRDQFLKKEHFSFTFSANGKLKVSYSKGHNDPDEYLSDRLVQRLLNADDMRKHLPLEVESQMAAKPQKEIEIATRFAEEFLTFFFQIHYNIATQILQIPKSESSTLPVPLSP